MHLNLCYGIGSVQKKIEKKLKKKQESYLYKCCVESLPDEIFLMEVLVNITVQPSNTVLQHLTQ